MVPRKPRRRHVNEASPLLGDERRKSSGGYGTSAVASDEESLLSYDDEKTEIVVTSGKTPSLVWALAKAFGGPFIRGAMLKVVQDLLTFVSPVVLE